MKTLLKERNKAKLDETIGKHMVKTTVAHVHRVFFDVIAAHLSEEALTERYTQGFVKQHISVNFPGMRHWGKDKTSPACYGDVSWAEDNQYRSHLMYGGMAAAFYSPYISPGFCIFFDVYAKKVGVYPIIGRNTQQTATRINNIPLYSRERMYMCDFPYQEAVDLQAWSKRFINLVLKHFDKEVERLTLDYDKNKVDSWVDFSVMEDVD